MEKHLQTGRRGDLMVRAVGSGSSDPGQVRTLAGDIVLCSWARHFTLTVPLSTQVYKWVPANCWGKLTNCGGVTFFFFLFFFLFSKILAY